MRQPDNFLHTTHRTATWFNKAMQRHELELHPPFQRNPVWTTTQKSYLIDTMLQGLPVPELYMQDTVDLDGNEAHIVVDGQQRIRAVLDFVTGDYVLEGEDVMSRWQGLDFESMSPDEKQTIFSYKFVVRILPTMSEEELRRIFARLNRNVVALNEQELRNATYWGPFIKAIQSMADDDSFWAASGIFTANEHRRMLDHEFISELAIAYLHGPQNKKDKLDDYYQLHEVSFERRDELVDTFSKITGEIAQLLPNLSKTRWKKKSDFYTMFLVFAVLADQFPLARDEREDVASRILELGRQVDGLTSIQEEEWGSANPLAMKYAKSVARAASDRSNRVSRAEAFSAFVFSSDSSATIAPDVTVNASS